MSIIGVPSSLNGIGNSKLEEPASVREAEKVLTGAPLTQGYIPRLPVTSFWERGTGNAYVMQIWQDIEPMLLHPKVILPYSYYKSGIAHADFTVKANSPEIQRYVEIMLNRFWERSLEQVQHAYDYGWIGAEPTYQMESGYLTYQYLWPFAPLDTWALTDKQQYRGISVASVPKKGKVYLWGPRHWPAKGFFFAHNKRFHRFYGRSQLYGAWRPWRRLAFRDGMEEVLDGGWYRYSYRGVLIRFPAIGFPKSDNPGAVDWEMARSRSQEIAEQAKTGASFALPNDWDEAAGKYKWDIEWPGPSTQLNLDGMIDVINYLSSEISYGVGVPPELMQAAETGSGWSGRKVPLIGFYVGQMRNARAIVWAWKSQIGDPLVRWNFGPKAKYEVEIILRVPEGISDTGMQPGAPPGPGGPPPPAPGAQPGQPPIQMSTWRSKPTELALPFDLAPPPEEPPAPHWSDLLVKEAIHLRLLGETKSGKSVMARALVHKEPGQVFIIDPVYEPGTWGGLPVVTVAPDGTFGPIQNALVGLMQEMKRRGKQLQSGQKDFERLTVFWDEVPNTVAELPKIAGEFIKRMGNYGRHVDMHLVGLGQSEYVSSWGISGAGDTAENFATVYLGDKARIAMPELTGVEYPAVLEMHGEKMPLDTTGMLELSKQPVSPAKAFQLPEVAGETLEDIHLSTEPDSEYWDRLYQRVRRSVGEALEGVELATWREEDHPRGQPGNAGEFTSKGQNVARSEILSRDEWEKAGQPVPHPDELERTAEAEWKAIVDFLAQFPDPGKAAREEGQIEPDPSTYGPNRDEEFAKHLPNMPSCVSKLPVIPRLRRAGAETCGEDARLAIATGRKLGYSEQDIAHYLLWNYVPDGPRILAGTRKWSSRKNDPGMLELS